MSTRASAVRIGAIADGSPIMLKAGLSSSIRLSFHERPHEALSTPQRLLQQSEVLEQHLQIHRLRHAGERAGGERVVLDRLGQVRAVDDDADVARLGLELETAAD